MRRRITKAFFATAAAGATITTLGLAASTAGAAVSGHHFALHFNPSAPQAATDANGPDCGATDDVRGTWSSADCGKAGYVATGRDFRFASATITVPAHNGLVASDPMIYMALDASAANNDFARAGVEPCSTGIGGTCPVGDTSGWMAFSQIQEPGAAAINNTAAVSPSLEGDGLAVSVYLVPTGNSVHFVVSSPSAGTVLNTTDPVSGPVYTDAQALADWTTATTQPAPVFTAPEPKTRDTQFLQGRFTTASGAQGTFKGPWSLTAVDATTNGALPPSGTLIAQPSFLWNDGNSFGGLGSDAFGVWRYPF